MSRQLRLLMRWAVAVLVLSVLAGCIGVMTAGELRLRIQGPFTPETEGIVTCSQDGEWLVLKPVSAGRTMLTSGDGQLLDVSVSRTGLILERSSGCYSGWKFVRGVIAACMAVILALAVFFTRRQLRQELYSYASPLMLAVCLVLLFSLAGCLIGIGQDAMDSSAGGILNALTLFQLVALPLLIVFFGAMLVSNLALIRHEGRSLRNLLGSAIGMILCAGTLLLLNWNSFSGSEQAYRIHAYAVNGLSAVLVWVICQLAGIIICGLLAAGGKPDPDRDYVLILGCRLSRRGGLTPLLRGRVDKALDFCAAQERKTGRSPILIPCGGQGKDELTSEASAMRTYLLEKGIPEDRIACEDRSANTWENMRNAMAMMPEGSKAAFSTTNYHVFRAGVWAWRNGLKAQGMGSRTKWYYWPNAFMREYVALLEANRWHELVNIVIVLLAAAGLTALSF